MSDDPALQTDESRLPELNRQSSCEWISTSALSNGGHSINSARLRLKLVHEEDAREVAEVASLRIVSDCMISIPHPYPSDEASRWTQLKLRGAQTGECFAFRIDCALGFCGVVELRDIDFEHEQGELSFWLAPERQGNGYATEAAAAVVAFGFLDRGLNRIVAFHMVRNKASGRVLSKLGFQPEGLLRERVKKWGVYEDVRLMAILRRDFVKPQTDWAHKRAM